MGESIPVFLRFGRQQRDNSHISLSRRLLAIETFKPPEPVIPFRNQFDFPRPVRQASTMSAEHAQVERLIRAARFNEAATLCEHILAENPNDLKILYLRALVHQHTPGLAQHRSAYEPKVGPPPSNPHPKCGWGGRRPGAGRKRGDGPSTRKTSSKYVRPIPDRHELKRRADAHLRELEIRKQLDRIYNLLQHRRDRALVIQP
jgi:hypothetical protein